MIDYGLRNRVVLITGVNNPQGIGAAAALAFAREGARLVLENRLRAMNTDYILLASEKARMLTGQVIKVSGGHAL